MTEIRKIRDDNSERRLNMTIEERKKVTLEIMKSFSKVSKKPINMRNIKVIMINLNQPKFIEWSLDRYAVRRCFEAVRCALQDPDTRHQPLPLQ